MDTLLCGRHCILGRPQCGHNVDVVDAGSAHTHDSVSGVVRNDAPRLACWPAPTSEQVIISSLEACLQRLLRRAITMMAAGTRTNELMMRTSRGCSIPEAYDAPDSSMGSPLKRVCHGDSHAAERHDGTALTLTPMRGRWPRRAVVLALGRRAPVRGARRGHADGGGGTSPRPVGGSPPRPFWAGLRIARRFRRR